MPAKRRNAFAQTEGVADRFFRAAHHIEADAANAPFIPAPERVHGNALINNDYCAGGGTKLPECREGAAVIKTVTGRSDDHAALHTGPPFEQTVAIHSGGRLVTGIAILVRKADGIKDVKMGVARACRHLE